MPKPNPTWATIVLMVVVFLKRTYERLFSPRACTGKRSVILLSFPLRHCWLPAPKPGRPRADSPAPPRFQPPPYTEPARQEKTSNRRTEAPRGPTRKVMYVLLYCIYYSPDRIRSSSPNSAPSSPPQSRITVKPLSQTCPLQIAHHLSKGRSPG